jgi:hypothetical protein
MECRAQARFGCARRALLPGKLGDVSELMTPPVADALRELRVRQPVPVANREQLLHLPPSFHVDQLDASRNPGQMCLPEQLPHTYNAFTSLLLRQVQVMRCSFN